MYEYKGTVVNVVDGDTIDVMVDLGFKTYKEVRIRLKDIDTPEIYRPSCNEELEHGRKAKEYVQYEVLDRTVTVQTYKDKTGKYGRYIASVFYYDRLGAIRSLSQVLKENGFEKRAEY